MFFFVFLFFFNFLVSFSSFFPPGYFLFSPFSLYSYTFVHRPRAQICLCGVPSFVWATVLSSSGPFPLLPLAFPSPALVVMLRSVWVDRLRLAFAALVPDVQEGYVPAQHDTGWTGAVASWQAQCHDLAALGVLQAFYPFPDELSGLALLYHDGRLVVHLDELLLEAPDTRRHPSPCMSQDSVACQVWSDQVAHCQLSASALRCSFWLRSSGCMFTSQRDRLRCPYCRQACSGWGEHSLYSCMVLAGGALYGFFAAFDHMASLGMPLSLADTCTLQCPASSPWRLQLCHDESPPVDDHTATITWSGLLLAGPSLPLSRSFRKELAGVYLHALGHWVEFVPVLNFIFLWILSLPSPPLPLPCLVIGNAPIRVFMPLQVGPFMYRVTAPARSVGGPLCTAAERLVYGSITPPPPLAPCMDFEAMSQYRPV